MDSSSKLTLGYWNIRGLAEPIRLVLEECGLEYTENKVDNTNEGLESWMILKEELKQYNPFANLPYLIHE